MAGGYWKNYISDTGVGLIAFGALAGGVGAELSEGNFFKGFVQSGIVAGLNHAMHSINSNFDDADEPTQKNSRRKRLFLMRNFPKQK